MPIRSAIVALLLCVGVSAAADSPRLNTLTGTPVSGELVSVNAKSVIFKVAGKNVETPLDQVLSVDIAPAPNAPPTAKDTKYIDVELTDGTLLHCGQFAIKGKEVQVTLLSGQDVKFPLADLRSYLIDGHDHTFREDWKKYLAKRTNFDQVVVRTELGGVNALNSLSGTVGEADKNGEKIEFALARGGSKSVPLMKIRGIIFQRGPNPAAAPVVCRVFDINANLIIASAVTLEGDRLSVTTPNGVKLELPHACLARLDYSPGKLVYLCDGNPKIVTEDGGPLNRVRRGKNLDGGPIQVRGYAPFTRGLAIHADTTLEYDLAGEFREFKAIIGVDELVGGTDGITKIVIKGDGKELKSYEVSRKDKKALDVRINIENVKSLRIDVVSPELLDLGHHVDLADARVSK
jgi:hypothetical protein